MSQLPKASDNSQYFLRSKKNTTSNAEEVKFEDIAITCTQQKENNYAIINCQIV